MRDFKNYTPAKEKLTTAIRKIASELGASSLLEELNPDTIMNANFYKRDSSSGGRAQILMFGGHHTFRILITYKTIFDYTGDYSGPFFMCDGQRFLNETFNYVADNEQRNVPRYALTEQELKFRLAVVHSRVYATAKMLILHWPLIHRHIEDTNQDRKVNSLKVPRILARIITDKINQAELPLNDISEMWK